MPFLTWRPCDPQETHYNLTLLTPLSCRMQERHKGVRQHYQAVSESESSAACSFSPRKTFAFPRFELLWPTTHDLIRRRLLTFYEVESIEAAMAEARVKILAARWDWSRTWDLLRRQRASYERKERWSLGFLSEWVVLKGLQTLRAVRRAAKRAGVRAEELWWAVEAFAERREGSETAMGMVERKEWEALAGLLLMDRETVALMRKGVSESEGEINAERASIVQRYFSLLEHENQCAGICCFSGCRKRKVVYDLSRSAMGRLDGSLELQRQLVRVSRPATVRVVDESDSESEHKRRNAEIAGRQRKRVRISVDANEQEKITEGSQRASWNSERERQKRRMERREFVFGKEEDENESEDEEKAEAQRKEREWKRRQSIERVMAANAKWEQEYVRC